MQPKEETRPRAEKSKRVFVVDQYSVVRLAVTEWLKKTRDLAVCGAVEDPAGALRAVLDLKPDIVVTEIMRAQDLDFIRSLHQQNPHLPILVFSFRDEGWYAAGLKSGGVRLFDEGSDQRRAGARNSHGFERASCSQSNHQGSAL